MSEFKIIGVRYCSQWNGNSANPGTAISPYAHPADAPNSNDLLVLGTGVYTGGWSGARRIVGDGKVIIDALNGTLPFFSTSAIISSNIHLRNVSNTIVNNFPVFQNCIFENVQFLNFNGGAPNLANASRENIFIGTNFSSNFESSMNSHFSIWLASHLRFMNQFHFNFVDKTQFVLFNGTSAGLTNNCINGLVRIGAIDYELKFLVNGSPRPDANPIIPDLATASGFSNVYTNGNFAGDPMFIDLLNRLVDANSDLLKKSGTFGFIGGVRPGKSIPVNSSSPDIEITTTDIDTTDSQNWIIQSPATEGFINIIWKVADNISEIQRIFLDAILRFNGAAAGGSLGNNNVPDIFPTSYSPLSQAGLKPNRLLYRLRTSQSIGKPTIDAQWDNDNVALGTTPGEFYLQEWNTKPTISTVLGVPYGNGSPEFVNGTPNGINARWAHARIRLTNNRAF